jgi:hypothetical protein
MGQRKKERQKEQKTKGYEVQKETRQGMTERRFKLPVVTGCHLQASFHFDVCSLS